MCSGKRDAVRRERRRTGPATLRWVTMRHGHQPPVSAGSRRRRDHRLPRRHRARPADRAARADHPAPRPPHRRGLLGAAHRRPQPPRLLPEQVVHRHRARPAARRGAAVARRPGERPPARAVRRRHRRLGANAADPAHLLDGDGPRPRDDPRGGAGRSRRIPSAGSSRSRPTPSRARSSPTTSRPCSRSPRILQRLAGRVARRLPAAAGARPARRRRLPVAAHQGRASTSDSPACSRTSTRSPGSGSSTSTTACGTGSGCCPTAGWPTPRRCRSPTRERDEPDWSQGYGFQLWMSRHGYRGDGAFGQYMVVLPEQDAVVAMFSCIETCRSCSTRCGSTSLPAMARHDGRRRAAADDALAERLADLSLPTAGGATRRRPAGRCRAR